MEKQKVRDPVFGIEVVLVLTLLSVPVFRRIYGSTRWKEVRSN